MDCCSSAADRGLQVIIAGAGGAAHLPPALASLTLLPVIGVPQPLAHLDGLDSLLSIVQMLGRDRSPRWPSAAPATLPLAVRILAVADPGLRQRMTGFGSDQAAQAAGAALRVSQVAPRPVVLPGQSAGCWQTPWAVRRRDRVPARFPARLAGRRPRRGHDVAVAGRQRADRPVRAEHQLSGPNAPSTARSTAAGAPHRPRPDAGQLAGHVGVRGQL
jgi:phosphoribosylaminoimidazole carboxylase PurE protein